MTARIEANSPANTSKRLSVDAGIDDLIHPGFRIGLDGRVADPTDQTFAGRETGRVAASVPVRVNRTEHIPNVGMGGPLACLANCRRPARGSTGPDAAASRRGSADRVR